MLSHHILLAAGGSPRTGLHHIILWICMPILAIAAVLAIKAGRLGPMFGYLLAMIVVLTIGLASDTTYQTISDAGAAMLTTVLGWFG